uniref:MFS domain-containing protein n=2 Tax=Macrostomum lignano TaxID=282301 RepID=A0A1I8I8U8_9PLAT
RDQITLAFTITQVVTPFGNVASGFILDRWGFRVVKTIAAALFGLGSLCFTLVQPGVDWLIFPGTIMLGISGVQIIMSNLQLSTMVKFPFVVASIISGLFDACTMVTSVLKQISRSNVNSFIAFGVYTGLGVLTISLTVALYPGKYNRLQVDSGPATQKQKPSCNSNKETQQQQHEEKNESNVKPTEIFDASEERNPRCSAIQFLLTTDFFLMVLWMICNSLRLSYFFGSLNDYVDLITDGDKNLVEHYATMFGYFFLTSPLVSLLPGLLLDLQKRFIPTLRQNSHRSYKLNTVTTLTLTALIGAISCLMMLPNSTGILIPTFVAISVFRAFMYSTLGNYCISVFKPENFGTVYCAIICTMAPFAFLTVPLTQWLQESSDPD